MAWSDQNGDVVSHEIGPSPDDIERAQTVQPSRPHPTTVHTMSTRSDGRNSGHDGYPSPEANGSEKESRTRPPSLSGNSDKYYHQEDGVTKIEALCE
jgi:hypothetical protein